MQHRSLTRSPSAGIVGPVSQFLNDPDAPENANAETLGTALFNDDGFDAWSDLYKVNTFSIYYMTTAFLALLDKGSRDFEGYTSSVVNITSVSGMVKIAQRHVSPPFASIPSLAVTVGKKFAYNSAKAAAGHLTKMLATEIALKGIPVRVNAIAPGVYSSEMTLDTITSLEDVASIAQSLIPVPAGRGGSYVKQPGNLFT